MYAFLVAKRSSKFWVPESGDYESVPWGNFTPLLTHSAEPIHSEVLVIVLRRCGSGFNASIFCRLNWISPSKNIAVSGFPWDTTIAVEWVDSAKPADASEYVNEGPHHQDAVGKVVYLHAYLDTQLTEAL